MRPTIDLNALPVKKIEVASKCLKRKKGPMISLNDVKKYELINDKGVLKIDLSAKKEAKPTAPKKKLKQEKTKRETGAHRIIFYYDSGNDFFENNKEENNSCPYKEIDADDSETFFLPKYEPYEYIEKKSPKKKNDDEDDF